jgi:23S rRNA pseudouridine1911/1915/1917 synthase
MSVVESGKQAVTHYRVLKKYSAHSYIRLRLESGRTHQIRVHMAHIRHPVVGDPVYGGRPKFPKKPLPELVNALQQFSRQALHASALRIVHPVSGTEMSWNAPLPPDMSHLLELLEKNG